MTNPSTILRAAGYCFTWRRMSDRQVRVSLWRLDAGRRHWVTCALAKDDRDAIRARALALLAWARSIPGGAGQDVHAESVRTSLALTGQRLARLDVAAPFAARAPHARVSTRRAA